MNVEQVVTEYQSALRGFLLSRLGNPADVDDLLQEIFTKTFLKLPGLREDDKIKSWLFQIANNAIIDHHRRAGRNLSVAADDLWYGEQDQQSQHAFEQCVEPFLRALPASAGDLLRAIELDGVSQKEYALQNGVSYSTLKSRVQTARKQLRGLFDECCEMTVSADGSVVDFARRTSSCDSC